MSKNIIMIINPASGRQDQNKKILKKVKKARKIMSKRHNVDTIYTQPNVSILELLNGKSKPDYFVVCGGDGTLNQVTQALYDLEWNIPIGYLPMGTTNDFAKNFNSNTNNNNFDVNEINLDDLKVKKVDIGKFNEKTFNYVAAMGLFSKASYSTNREQKKVLGRLAYLLNGIKEIFSIKSYKLKVKSKGKKIEDDFIYVSVSNSNYLGGFDIYRNEDVKLDDGEFEVLLVKKPKTFNKSIKLILDILNGKLDEDNIYFFKTSELLIEGNEDLEWSLDGEYSGKQKEVRIKNSKERIKYIVSN